MSQLRLAYVNCSIVSKPTKLFSRKSDSSPEISLPPLAHKVARLHALKPGAAAVVEGIVDALLVEAEGRKL